MHRRTVLATLAIGTLSVAGTALAAAPPVGTLVNISGPTTTVSATPTIIHDQGTVTGSPIGSASADLYFTLFPKRGLAKATFVFTNATGSITGGLVCTYATNRLRITFSGRAVFASGTGAYAGIKATTLQFNDIHSLSGQEGGISLIGRATLPAS